MTRSDIRRVVIFLLDKYGADAAERATENVDWAIANGDVEGTRNWMEVVRLIVGTQPNANAVVQDGERPMSAGEDVRIEPIQSPGSPVAKHGAAAQRI